MTDDTIEKTYEERKKCIKELRKIMKGKYKKVTTFENGTNRSFDIINKYKKENGLRDSNIGTRCYTESPSDHILESGPLRTKQRLFRSAEPRYIKTLGHVNNIFEGDIVRDEIHPKYITSLGAVTTTPKFLNGNVWQVIPHLKEDEFLQNLESDDDYLERFLDCTDFNLEKALERLRTFYELLEECPNWFTQGCPTEKKSVIDKDIRIIPKEYDKEGRPIYIVKLANMDSGTMDLVEDVVAVDDFFAETLLSETAAAKNGVCCLIDVANFSWKLMKWLTPTAISMILRRVVSMPVKDYRFHIINNSFLINTAIKFVWPFIPKYLREKIFFHYNDYDSLYQHVDKDVLPVEYGGKNDSDYRECHAWVYDKNSHIAESFFRNRTMFLENLDRNKNKK